MVPLQGTREKFPTDASCAANTASKHRRHQGPRLFSRRGLLGICRAEPWMYYSHDEVEGRPIEAYHEYAVVMLIDQGFETMEGASGDDWISASQSMRAYMRGAKIAGVMAAHCRKLGSRRALTPMRIPKSFTIPPSSWRVSAGLADRDTVLNPFIGPRSKSVVSPRICRCKSISRSTSACDFCSQCRKCARECPVTPSLSGRRSCSMATISGRRTCEKCTRYRVTQNRGSACGRCMKMCPWNREDTQEARELTLLSINSPQSRRWIIEHDDRPVNGTRNLDGKRFVVRSRGGRQCRHEASGRHE